MPPEIAAARYGAPAAAPHPPDCSPRETGCLAAVRADRDAYAARLRDEATLVERVRGLAAYDALHLPRDLFDVQAVGFPIPGMRNTVLLTQRAFVFVEGRTTEALDGLCSDLITWRRLGANTNFLIPGMQLTAHAAGHARLFADMLAEWPSDAQLPAICEAAFAAPAKGELSVCNALRGELAYRSALLDGMDQPDSTIGRFGQWVLFDREGMKALAAEEAVGICSADIEDTIARDIRVR